MQDDDEADTVGCCTLKVENVVLVPPNKLQVDGFFKIFLALVHSFSAWIFDIVFFFFLKKKTSSTSSVKILSDISTLWRLIYLSTKQLENSGLVTALYVYFLSFYSYPSVHLLIFACNSLARKSDGEDLFDMLDTSKLNAHLKELMPGLTAKVFRTYNASITLDDIVSINITDFPPIYEYFVFMLFKFLLDEPEEPSLVQTLLSSECFQLGNYFEHIGESRKYAVQKLVFRE